MLVEGRAHLRAMSLLQRFPERRYVPLTLNTVLSLSDKDGDNNNCHGRGEGEEITTAVAGPYCLFSASVYSSM